MKKKFHFLLSTHTVSPNKQPPAPTSPTHSGRVAIGLKYHRWYFCDKRPHQPFFDSTIKNKNLILIQLLLPVEPFYLNREIKFNLTLFDLKTFSRWLIEEDRFSTLIMSEKLLRQMLRRAGAPILNCLKQNNITFCSNVPKLSKIKQYCRNDSVTCRMSTFSLLKIHLHKVHLLKIHLHKVHLH
jgi:hypothetical protein